MSTPLEELLALIHRMERRVRPTVCNTHSVNRKGQGIMTREGRISELDLDSLMMLARNLEPVKKTDQTSFGDMMRRKH